MNSLDKYINFQKLTSEKFEELCFELILKHGFSKVIWRKGGADDGRDIEGRLTINNSLIDQYEETFFFECKNFEKGVPPEKLNSKIAWADAEKPQHLVFFISSYVTNNARTWLDKIEKDKAYRIHPIEGERLIQLVSQHEDLVVKYFVDDKIMRLLDDTINSWVLHQLIPTFHTYSYLLKKLDFSKLSIQQKVFLYSLYYVHHSKLEELENENYHGINISHELDLLQKSLQENSNYQEPVLKRENVVDALSIEGYLGFDKDEPKDYDFIATEVVLYPHKEGKPKLTYYLFKRIDSNTALEILLYNNSTLEFKIRKIEGYRFSHFKESVNYIERQQWLIDRLIEDSKNMK